MTLPFSRLRGMAPELDNGAMVDSPSSLDRVRRLRREIADNIAKAMARIDSWRTEDNELEITERVLQRLEPQELVSEEARQAQEPVANGHDADGRGGKPAGIPTIPQMIVTALKESGLGQGGMEPSELTAFIAKRWWPDVQPSSIGPIAWRMAQKGRLDKDGPRYRLKPGAAIEGFFDTSDTLKEMKAD